MSSSSDLEVISGEKYFFLQKLIIIVYVLINTFLIKLIFYPLKQPRKKKYLRKVNRQKLHKKLGNWTVSQTLLQRQFILMKKDQRVQVIYFMIFSTQENLFGDSFLLESSLFVAIRSKFLMQRILEQLVALSCFLSTSLHVQCLENI